MPLYIDYFSYYSNLFIIDIFFLNKKLICIDLLSIHD